MFEEFEGVTHGLQDHSLLVLLHVGADVLMQAHDMDVVLLCHLDGFFQVVLVYAELALGTTRNHVVAAPCPHLRIYPQINVSST